MTTNVEPGDWTSLDSWWKEYKESHSIAQFRDSPRVYGLEELAQHWQALEPWIQIYTDSALATQGSVSPEVVGLDRLANDWRELDPWWNAYSETGHETAIEIAELVRHSNEIWRDSNGPFDKDPLSADLTKDRFLRGPLQPGGELEWSQWLAQLLSPSDALVEELFDVQVDEPPSEVIREARLPKQNGGFRRADIVVRHAERAVSIEVKLGDENYGKTGETARLAEQKYDQQEWDHVLLLPKQQKQRLDAIVSPPIRFGNDGQLKIAWDEPGPITVLFWQDVAAAVRSVLRRGDVVDDHWAANAYLFCSVVEQELMGFKSQSAVEKMADPASVVNTLQPISIAYILEEQLTYLQSRFEHD